MELDYLLLGIALSLGINFGLLYTRKYKWNSDALRWSLTVILLILGFLGLLGIIENDSPNFSYFSWCLITPFIYNVFDWTFKKISIKRNKRDFYLWLQGSNEIDDTIDGKNPHVNSIDKLFSLILLIIIISLPLMGMT
ncbi:hypothetical protein [Roseivirga thermotolerans]|jgi:hypothetical protein|uniref:Uncharacterized protein n=1 Tax=Roseivirga thermotolerans TaxID=1758176 RepID=A0ABQ3I3D4_9BACT|nr:hypothetical protein [Roseivirga thermotolerans]MEC7754226.1 hypothetical protein [Bacteroidota bacterium]GHE50805.1 hypothetical protein GCM10011340_00990 [Roseivirga thermotolerans]